MTFLVQGAVTPDDSVSTVKIQDDAVTLAKMASGTDGNLITYDASGDPAAVATGTSGHVLTSGGAGVAPTFAAGGTCVQVVNTQTGAQSTGTTQIPWDDTIPQITEGTEFMTLAVTPGNTNNILIIEVVLQISRSSAGYIIAALFQDSTANALDAVAIYEGGTGGEQDNMVWRYKMIAGTTSETTFRVRAGPNASATVYFNGDSSRKLGGVFASSITVREYTV